MNKNKFITAVITIVISAIILLAIIYFTFNNNKINQGNFRVSDSILSSIVEFKDKAENDIEWKYDISQSNKISMLVQKIGDAHVKEVYIDDIKIKSKNDVSIYVEQDKYDLRYEYKDIKNKKVNIYTEETEAGDYLVEFDVVNENIIENFIIPEGINEIRHDGTILNTANIAISQIQFKVKYDLVVVQDNKKTNTCKVEIKMPDEKIAIDGFFVQRLDSSNYNFKVSY